VRESGRQRASHPDAQCALTHGPAPGEPISRSAFSWPTVALEDDQDPDRADICLGTDASHTCSESTPADARASDGAMPTTDSAFAVPAEGGP
jgi:hypothetical protein